MFNLPLNITFFITIFLLFLFPLLILLYLKIPLVLSSITSFLRMTLQLILAGFYLEILFHYNYLWLNLLWLFVIFLVAAFTIVHRSELKNKYFFLPVLFSFSVSTIINTFILLTFILQLKNPWSARYLIPLSGMIAGNSMRATITAIRSFNSELKSNEMIYRFYLASGATRHETYLSLFQKAMADAIQPIVASVATMGLVFLPGFMTGSIIGGEDPTESIFYQAVIMIAFFSNSVFSSFLSLSLISRLTNKTNKT